MYSAGTGAGMAVRLPVVCTVGFGGHRSLPDEGRARGWVHAFLTEYRQSTTDTLCGISSVAEGADLLFAESCIELGIPLRILLPIPAEDFRADFEARSWSRAEEVMARAISVEVVGSAASRAERYYECGVETVQQCDVLLVLWDGVPARGLGGTAEMADFAQRTGRPIVWIHSDTGAVDRTAVESTAVDRTAAQRTKGGQGVGRARDPELEFLNDLPLKGPVVAGASGRSFAEGWLARLDANAVLVAPQVRRLAAIPIVCTALAAFLSAAGRRLPAPGLWLGMGAVLGLVAALLPTALRLGKRQAMWVRIRTAAEVTRSILAVWDAPDRTGILGKETLPELSGMLHSLELLRSRDGKSSDVAAFKAQYLTTRLFEQKQYYLRQAKRAAVQGRRFHHIAKVAGGVAIAMSAWISVAPVLLHAGPGYLAGSWLPLLASALFQAAAIAGALVVVHDCDRRLRRYDDVYKSLAAWELEFAAYRTWRPVLHVVQSIERALLVELLEWRALLQNRKMPRH